MDDKGAYPYLLNIGCYNIKKFTPKRLMKFNEMHKPNIRKSTLLPKKVSIFNLYIELLDNSYFIRVSVYFAALRNKTIRKIIQQSYHRNRVSLIRNAQCVLYNKCILLIVV